MFKSTSEIYFCTLNGSIPKSNKEFGFGEKNPAVIVAKVSLSNFIFDSFSSGCILLSNENLYFVCCWMPCFTSRPEVGESVESKARFKLDTALVAFVSSPRRGKKPLQRV